MIGELRAFEREWLGFASAPMADRLRQAGWAPDAPEAYCARCGTSVGPGENRGDTGEPRCRACEGVKLGWSRAFRLGPYEGVLRQLVLEVKFSRWHRLGEELGELLGFRLGEAMGALQHAPVVTPVPMSLGRRLSRGIDHTMALCRGVRRATGVDVVRALSRGPGPGQTGLTGASRKANVLGRFEPRRRGAVDHRVCILVDDVRTTGATMGAAARAIRAGNPEVADVWCAVVGVTPERGDGGLRAV